jgi:hypothetical protein
MNAKQRITYGQAPRIALWIGILLTLVGLASRYLLGMRGGTSLLPSVFGLPIALMGFVAIDPQYAQGTMRGVAVLSLLGILASLHIVPRLNDMLLGRHPPGSTVAILSGSAMLLLCGILLIVCSLAFARVWIRRTRK